MRPGATMDPACYLCEECGEEVIRLVPRPLIGSPTVWPEFRALLRARIFDAVYSIISSARLSSNGGNAIPSAFAALRFMASPIFLTNCTGRSAGVSPLRIRPA